LFISDILSDCSDYSGFQMHKRYNPYSNIDSSFGVELNEIELYFGKVSNDQINLHPNPTSGITTVSLKNKIIHNSLQWIKVCDLFGRLVYFNQMNDYFTFLDFSNYPRGVYLIYVYDMQRSYFKKLIVN
jgi:hypothetical protein